MKRRDLSGFTDDELRAAIAEPIGRKHLEAALAQLRQQDRAHADQLRRRHEAFQRELKKALAVAQDRGTMIRRLEGVLGTAEREL